MATYKTPGGTTGGKGDVPPVLLYLPGVGLRSWNTTARLAEIFRLDLTRGPGKYAVQAADTIDTSMTDGQRLLDEHGDAVLELYTVDYRDRLGTPTVAAGGLKGLVISLAFQLWYFARVVALFFPARKRAKSLMAKVQLLIGFGATLALLVMIVVTCLAILAALGLYKPTHVPDNAVNAVALGFTAISTWLLARVVPQVRNVVVVMQKLLDYAEDERLAQGVSSCLADALDAVLEKCPTRQVNIVGYSLGSLVALDYLCPRASTSPDSLDKRLQQAVRVVVTIGCPLDFVRLLFPSYTADRLTRTPDAVWTNIFIPADVFGSNFGDEGDDEVPQKVAVGAQVGGLRLAENRRYTDQKLSALNIWGQHGFLSHVGYWDEPTAGSCLPLVWQALVTRTTPLRNQPAR
jgi:pimeloyl-ACP methyl ester carboxylesterase